LTRDIAQKFNNDYAVSIRAAGHGEAVASQAGAGATFTAALRMMSGF